MGQSGLANPSQRQTGDGDAELDGVEYVIELLMKLLDGARPDAMGGNQLLQTRFADAYQSEFSGHKERVRRDQQNHCYDPQHNESNHEAYILSFARRPTLSRAGVDSPEKWAHDGRIWTGWRP
jgi:hypothetical protein